MVKACAPVRLVASVAALVVCGCATLEPLFTRHDHSRHQYQRILQAEQDLESLVSIDTFVKLDNELLGERIEAELRSLDGEWEGLRFEDMQVGFERQYIPFEATASISGDDGSVSRVGLHGEILLMFSADRLIWQPRFNEVEPAISTGPPPDSDAAASGSGERMEALLALANGQLARNLLSRGNYTIEMNPMPLGILEVGASVTGFTTRVASESHHLGGVFTTAGSATLVEPDYTSIALNLTFVPGFSPCPGNVRVSRSGFARDIVNREPVGVSRYVAPDSEIRHYFTEITGADEPTVVVHYWFANGQPVTVSELDIGPSARWRTWSSREAGTARAIHWEVIVVEKTTGCILESSAIRAEAPATEPGPAERNATRQAFQRYRDRFHDALAGFAVASEKPDVALIEVRRDFLSRVLGDGMRDLELVSELRGGGDKSRRFEAELMPFDPERLVCEERECTSRRECMVDYQACPVQRDTRDCLSCLFRNPLNNRCVKEGRDPICEAAKAARNAQLEQAREACIQRERSERDECERLRAQEVRSCEIEVAMAKNVCEARRKEIGELDSNLPVAHLKGEAEVSGPLKISFSGFDLANGLGRFGMHLGLSANLSVSGHLWFEPAPHIGTLQNCVADWRGTFNSRVSLPRWESGLTASTEAQSDALNTTWSGFTHRITMNPSPLQSMFVASPGLLAACRIGLKVSDLTDSLAGEQSGFFAGDYPFAIQPLPSRIQLLPAHLTLGTHTYTGAPRLTRENLHYAITRESASVTAD